MKRTKSFLGLFAALAAVVLALVVWAGIFPPIRFSAAASSSWNDDYDYDIYDTHSYDIAIQNYDVKMKIAKNRVISVVENIRVQFIGKKCRGISREFPLGGGVTYRKIECKSETDDEIKLFGGDDYISIQAQASNYVTGQIKTFTYTYEMVVPKLKAEDYCPLNVLGYGWSSDIASFRAEITLPGELNDYKIYSGASGAKTNASNIKAQKADNVITLTATNLKQITVGYTTRAPGITLDLSFAKGVLKPAPDYAPLFAVIAGLLLLGGAILVKMLVFRRPVIIKTVNLTAPNEMDPFLMGKLIDGKADQEDYGALLFHFAAKGYVHIDFTENKNNPTIYRSEKPFGADEPEHAKVMYEAMFKRRESLRVSELGNDFYPSADAMEKLVDQEAGKMFRGLFVPSIVFSAVCTAVFYIVFLVYARMTVHPSYSWTPMIVATSVAAAMPTIGTNLASRLVYKWKKKKLYWMVTGLTLGGVGIGSFFCLMNSAAFTWVTVFLCVLFSSAVGFVGGLCVVPTEEYAQKLGHILGFKQFIEVTERDKIKFMLENSPELYYEILPYAQVLGVTDAWTDKFKGIEISPPKYCQVSTTGDVIFNCIVFNAIFHSLTSSLTHLMSARGANSKAGSVIKHIGGGFGGGGFGGFGGGGFGGGGGGGC